MEGKAPRNDDFEVKKPTWDDLNRKFRLLERLTDYDKKDYEFFDFSKIPLKGFYNIGANRKEVLAVEKVACAAALVKRLINGADVAGSGMSPSEQALMLILTYAPLRGSEGTPLFEAPEPDSPWAAKFDNMIEGGNIHAKCQNTLMSVVDGAVKKQRGDQGNEKEGVNKFDDKVGMSNTFTATKPGHFLRMCLLAYRFVYSGNVENFPIYAKTTELAALFNTTEHEARFLLQESVLHFLSNIGAASKALLTALTLCNQQVQEKNNIFRRAHSLRMEGSGLAALNIIHKIMGHFPHHMDVGFAICSGRNVKEMASTILAYEMYYMPPEEQHNIDAIIQKYQIKDVPQDENSKKYGKYARCFYPCLQWCTVKSNSVTLQQLNGAARAVDEGNEAHQRAINTHRDTTSREYQIGRGAMTLLLQERK
ncbi:unnamed protein product, partial [Mesorhabditis belari]|uniref:Nucleoprotein n=1 Tax=Mesorhabditis belari TaxID=2138241 RepID=A0AAF3ELS1_9BILA